MTNVFILHGTNSHPEENYFRWLRTELESLGCRVIVPQFPTPRNQTLDNWLKVLEGYMDLYVDRTRATQDIIGVGHSLGGTVKLRYLERHDIRFKAVYTVGTAMSMESIADYEGKEDLESFLGQPFDWDLIRSRSHRFYVFHSDNDPWVGLVHGQQLAKHLGTELTLVPNAGHFNTESGYTKFELLLEKIRPNI